VQQGAVDGMREGDGLDDDGDHADRRERQGDTGLAAQSWHPGRESRVDEPGRTRLGGNGAHRLNVVSFT